MSKPVSYCDTCKEITLTRVSKFGTSYGILNPGEVYICKKCGNVKEIVFRERR